MSHKRQRYRGHSVVIACNDVPMAEILNAADELSNAAWDLIYEFSQDFNIPRETLTGTHARVWAAVQNLRKVMPK